MKRMVAKANVMIAIFINLHIVNLGMLKNKNSRKLSVLLKMDRNI